MHFIAVRMEEKSAALLVLLHKIIDINLQQTIVFASTRHHVEFLHDLLQHCGMESVVIYGSMDATARKINIAKFRNGSA